MLQKLNSAGAVIEIDIGKTRFTLLATTSTAPLCCDRSDRAVR